MSQLYAERTENYTLSANMQCAGQCKGPCASQGQGYTEVRVQQPDDLRGENYF